MEEIMIKQVSVLRQQMLSPQTLPEPEAAQEQGQGMFSASRRRYGRPQR